MPVDDVLGIDALLVESPVSSLSDKPYWLNNADVKVFHEALVAALDWRDDGEQGRLNEVARVLRVLFEHVTTGRVYVTRIASVVTRVRDFRQTISAIALVEGVR